MKALVLIGNGKLEYRDVPDPQKPGSDWYLVRIAAAGICGSDIHRAFEGGAYRYPLIMGHEFSGIIAENPPNGRYKKSQRVTVFPLLPCRACEPCRAGAYAQCTGYDYFGSRRDGAFAESLWVPEDNLFPLPDKVDIVHAAMTEPCAVALHGVRKLTIAGGESAAVFGAGPIGNMTAQWLRILGCGKVGVVDVDDTKLAIARAMGFATVNPKNGDPVAAVAAFCGKEGAGKVIEACGLPLTYRQSIQAAARFGEVVFMGNISGDFLLPPKEMSSVLRKELRLHGTWNSRIEPRGEDDWSTVLEHLDRDLDVAPLISHTPSLADGVDIFNRIVSKQIAINKVLFRLK